MNNALGIIGTVIVIGAVGYVAMKKIGGAATEKQMVMLKDKFPMGFDINVQLADAYIASKATAK